MTVLALVCYLLLSNDPAPWPGLALPVCLIAFGESNLPSFQDWRPSDR